MGTALVMGLTGSAPRVAAERVLRALTEGWFVSRASARHRHRKPPRPSSGRSGAAMPDRKRPAGSASPVKPAIAAAAALAGSALIATAWPVAAHWIERTPHAAGAGQADVVGLVPTGAHHNPARQQPTLMGTASRDVEVVSIAIASRPGRHRKTGPPAPAGYRNPLRDVSGLVPERIDQGVDFTGSGPVYALGDGVVTNAQDGYATGWPGGGWITYRLTNGPDAGLVVYLAEDVTPAVRAGQHVTPSTVIGNMFNGGDGIETGWAQPTGLSAESQLPVAGGIGGYGPFPTDVGLNFEELLQSLGVPAAVNRSDPAYGLLPANYPTTW